MPILDRSQIKEPVLPKETVEVPALGGEVVVRGLLLSERLELSGLNAEWSRPQAGETEEAARSRAGARMVSHTLARVVVLSDGSPIWTAEQWDRFGAASPQDVLALFKASRRLGGHDEEATEKN